MRRRAIGKYDRNHTEVANAFLDRGFTVYDSHQLGGFVDIVIAKYGINCLIEIKDGERPPSERKLTLYEQPFHDNWQGWIEIVERISGPNSVESVNRQFETMRERLGR